MIDELLEDESDRTTPWEVEFIEDMNKKRSFAISEKQAKAVERIWEKVFGNQ